MKKLLLLTFVFVILSCNSDDDNTDPQYCTEEYVFGLKVTLKDSITNAIVTEGLTVTARDGSYEEQLIRTENSNYYIGAGERQGTYVIEVISSTYQTFTSNNIVVVLTEDGCHVITKELEFELQPN